MDVVFHPCVASGVLKFEVVNVAIVVWEPAKQALNEALNNAISQLPPEVGLQSIVGGERFMTLLVRGKEDKIGGSTVCKVACRFAGRVPVF